MREQVTALETNLQNTKDELKLKNKEIASLKEQNASEMKEKVTNQETKLEYEK